MQSTATVTTIAIDLAKNVFQLALADRDLRVVRSLRLRRKEFLAFWSNYPVVQVVMEACGSAHHFGRWVSALGHRVTLLPAQHVYRRRRNKTDAIDCVALLEALRAADIRPVPIKTESQQVIQMLHRARQQWQKMRTAQINLAHGALREFGIAVPEGAARAVACMRAEQANAQLDPMIRGLLQSLLQEIAMLERRVADVDRQFAAASRTDVVLHKLQTLPGIGWVTASAIRASVGDIERFANARSFSAWIGMTPAQTASGDKRKLGRSKQGDTYVRTLVIQGARAVLAAAQRQRLTTRPLSAPGHWAATLADRRGFNKAAVGSGQQAAAYCRRNQKVPIKGRIDDCTDPASTIRSTSKRLTWGRSP